MVMNAAPAARPAKRIMVEGLGLEPLSPDPLVLVGGTVAGAGVGVAAAAGAGVGVAAATVHADGAMTLVSSVTAPVLASALPSNDAPVVIVIEACAMMVPLRAERVPRVAEVPSCQKTLQD
jgi:hypothetical protein